MPFYIVAKEPYFGVKEPCFGELQQRVFVQHGYESKDLLCSKEPYIAQNEPCFGVKISCFGVM